MKRPTHLTDENTNTARLRPYIEQLDVGICQVCKQNKLSNKRAERSQNKYDRLTFCKNCETNLNATVLDRYGRSFIWWLCDICTVVDTLDSDPQSLLNFRGFPLTDREELSQPNSTAKELAIWSEVGLHLHQGPIMHQLWFVCEFESTIGVFEVDTGILFIIDNLESLEEITEQIKKLADKLGGDTFYPRPESVDGGLETDLFISNI